MLVSIHKLFDMSRSHEPIVLKPTKDFRFVFLSIVYRKSRLEAAIYYFIYTVENLYKETCFQE
jgi:hypothetical protein